jgi:hypothetical protein
MQNLKARAPKEFVLFSLFVFYEIIIGHSISVLFSVEISLFFDKEIGKTLEKKNSSADSTNFAIILLNFTKF